MSKNLFLSAIAEEKCDVNGVEPLYCLKQYIFYHYYPTFSLKSGGYRSRTDDPLRARQVL